MLNYLSLVLIHFRKAGLFEALVRVGDQGEEETQISSKKGSTGTDDDDEKLNQLRRQNGVKATVLLGELLHLSSTTLVPEQVKELHTLPTLVQHAATFVKNSETRLDLADKRMRTRAGAMVAHLQQWASLKGGGDALMAGQSVNTAGANKFRRMRGHNRRLDRIEDIRLKMEWDIDEPTLKARLQATQVLATKDFTKWDFRLMSEALEGPLTNPSRMEIGLGTKFFKRILSFARPDRNQLFSLPWSSRNLRYVQVVAQCLEVLSQTEAGANFLMQNKLLPSLRQIINDEVEFVQSKQKESPERPLSPENMVRTMVKEYFTLIGALSGNKRGIQILNDTQIFSLLVPLISSGRSDLCKMIMTSLDYSQAGSARVLLSKVLQNKSMPIRYLATRHLHFLLRAGAGEFRLWGIDFACKALKDPEPRIMRAVVALLDEASDDDDMLSAFISRRPEILLSDDHPGKFLLYRFLSKEKGYEFLNQSDFIERELALWGSSKYVDYVRELEERLGDAVFSDSYKQPTETSLESMQVNLPPHLYGELSKSALGFQILGQNETFCTLMESVKNLDGAESALHKRAVVWAMGHVGASEFGFPWLKERGIVDAVMDQGVTATSLSLRGTCLMVLGLLCNTQMGRDHLRLAGWSHPVLEVPQLLAVPVDPRLCDLFFQVPQIVYTGGSWTPIFDDPVKLEQLQLSARAEAQSSARSLREATAARVIGGSGGRAGVSSPPPHRSVERGSVVGGAGAGDSLAAVPSSPRGRGQARVINPSPRINPKAGKALPLPPLPSSRSSGTQERKSPRPGGGGDASEEKPAVQTPKPPRTKPAIGLLNLQELAEANASFDADPVSDKYSEEVRTLLKHIVDMSNYITTDKASRALKKLRKDSPSLFADPQTFLAALKLLEMYRFRLIVRRFVYELFADIIITVEKLEATWDSEV